MIRYEQSVPEYPATVLILLDGAPMAAGEVKDEAEASAAMGTACREARERLCLPGRFDAQPVPGMLIVEYPDCPEVSDDPVENEQRRSAHVAAEWDRLFEQHRSSIERARTRLLRLGAPDWDTYEPPIVRRGS